MLEKLIEILSSERGEQVPQKMSYQQKKDYFRALCNARHPKPVSDKFLALQDQYLKGCTEQRGIVDVEELAYKNSIALWQGDITRLNSDGIVNACNAALLGCFEPLHNCIDNIIHTYAGVQVRLDCQEAMKGKQLPNGEVVVTSAYNLPSKYIFHTVGPIVRVGKPGKRDEADLASCYRSCIEKSVEMGIKHIAFCCLSTGVYGYPKELAAKVAVKTVKECIPKNESLKVIFNVFEDEDKEFYAKELSR